MKMTKNIADINSIKETKEALTMHDLFPNEYDVPVKRVGKSGGNRKKSELPLKYRQYISRAKTKGLLFELPLDTFNSLLLGKCIYCNNEGGTIDRVKSEDGYIEGNCVPCCRICNSMKNNLSVDVFKQHISLIYNHINSINYHK